VVRVHGYRSRGPGFDSHHYHIIWEVVGLERGQLILVSTTEELLEWKSSGSGSRKPRLTAVGIRCPALTSPTSGGRSVGIVRLRTKATVSCLLKLYVKAQCITRTFIKQHDTWWVVAWEMLRRVVCYFADMLEEHIARFNVSQVSNQKGAG
jgi:hypothetical protein